MRWSQTLIPTQKETPADAAAPSHVLLLRAGMIRQLGSGTYTYLPLGLRVLRKAGEIVRREMDAAGAIELLMPALQPIELWKESGRDESMREVLMRFKISGDRDVALGPTHEEVATDIARDAFKSYRQLPVTIYQIQTKFRDEPRPRFGIVRTREFLMKDAYSFGATIEQLHESYDAMYAAYCRIFEGCGLPYLAVEAESGPIGGDASHEFMVPSPSGEDAIIRCGNCEYAANRERAEVGPLPLPESLQPNAPAYRRVPTPGKRTIREVCEFLKVPEESSAKLLVYLADDKPVAVLIRGDHEANESKIRRHLGASSLEPADADRIVKETGAPMGFLGPVDCKIPLWIDQDVANLGAVTVGGNEVDVHLVGVVPGRDFPLRNVHDLRNAAAGDKCPRCGGKLSLGQGIEIGHVFKLGTKYSRAMDATFVDESGKSREMIMGCYGIGVNRILAAAVESSHDAEGIVWPLPLAPYEVAVVPLQTTVESVAETARRIAEELEAAGTEVLVDDREQRPGVKFKDVDLIGIPLRVVIGERGLKNGVVELKWRKEAKAREIPAGSAVETIRAELAEERKKYAAKTPRPVKS